MTRRLAEASQHYFLLASGEAAFLSYVGKRSTPPRDAERISRIRPYPGTLVSAELQLAEDIESDDAIQAARDAITARLPATDDIDDLIRFT